ncbi:MAG: glucokinase [Burkholderiaceae bacterium]
MMRVVADIGGTNARFARIGPDGLPAGQVRLAVADHADFASALEAALAMLGGPLPQQAVVAVAGPVHDGVCHLTNADWTIDRRVIAARLGSERVRVVNDFEAVALALPHLGPADITTLGPAEGPAADPRTAMKLALGPGTGLGVALHLGDAGGASVATEGGHVPLALADPGLLERLQAVAPPGPLEAEYFLSGPGLARLHRALHDRVLDEHQVTAAADAGEPAAQRTIALFLDLLAGFAASAALGAGALGGVYLAGGLVGEGRIRVDGARFRRTFNGEGRMAAWLARVPLHIITRADPAFLGLARVGMA